MSTLARIRLAALLAGLCLALAACQPATPAGVPVARRWRCA